MLARVRFAAPGYHGGGRARRVLCFQFPWTITALLETAKVQRTNPDVAQKAKDHFHTAVCRGPSNDLPSRWLETSRRRDRWPIPPLKTRPANFPSRRSSDRRNHGRVSSGKWSLVPTTEKKSYKGSGRLAGCKALITGGDSGMGRAAAIAYAREGADVAINYFPSEEPDAQEVIGLIKAEGRIGLAIPGDLRDEKFCQELVAHAREGLGGLDIIVNNAARQQSRESILDVSSDDFDATMKTNIYAPFWIIKAALPHLKPGAVIIGTSSEQAYDPSPSFTTTRRPRRRP